jgi:hypothetical protein
MEFGMQNPNKKQPICAGNQLYYNLRVQDLEIPNFVLVTSIKQIGLASIAR